MQQFLRFQIKVIGIVKYKTIKSVIFGVNMGYLDPGLLGVLPQIAMALGLVIISSLTFLFKPLKKLFSKKDKQDSDPEE